MPKETFLEWLNKEIEDSDKYLKMARESGIYPTVQYFEGKKNAYSFAKNRFLTAREEVTHPCS